MSPNAAPLTAIERARLAYEEMKRRQHGVAVQRRARERSRNITLAAIVGGSVAAYRGHRDLQRRDADSLRATAHEVRGDRTRTSEARTGQVRSYVKGNTCRELQFDNDSGTFVGGSLVLCDPGEKSSGAEPQLATPNAARFNSIRGGFAR